MKSANRHALIVILASFAVVGCLVWVGKANAASVTLQVIMSPKEARREVRRSGGSPHSCRRLGVASFRCRATYWSTMVEAEEIEGVVYPLTETPYAEEFAVIVTPWGVRRV